MIKEPVINKNKVVNLDQTAVWGISTSVDCYGCDPLFIRSIAKVKEFSAELIDYIEMKAYGPCHVVHFGEDDRVAGLSMFQLIETSCISAHFANQTNAAYIDIFSCKKFDPNLAADFCKAFFKAKSVNIKTNLRYAGAA